MINSANAVSFKKDIDPVIQNGKVISISGRDAQVTIKGFTVPARVAFSCLIQPIQKDLCLCSQNEDGEYFILGIIERQGDQDMTMSFPGDASMISNKGSISLSSQESITMASGESINCFSDKAVHKSREAVVDYNKITANGDTLQANFKSVLFISKVMSTMAKQVIQKAVNYVRHSEDSDQVKAGQITRKADGLYSMDSKHTMMVSKKETKIDGERIFMG